MYVEGFAVVIEISGPGPLFAALVNVEKSVLVSTLETPRSTTEANTVANFMVAEVMKCDY
ncbi:hypothetical protein F441_12984 [Phytophthora nicotianae CJ01A1]|uniref:Uncharacterized protein n=1 Tax=Phytophthora nicotianae CJ01A1 TaxID=1317063 RepID=W2WLR9_PHYNI|nr:hypothetical protein F441_12984 [Phytophthora nicotianae CJ01A1]